MILVNSSRKIINIGKNAILPGGEFEADETLMKNPIIKAFIKSGEFSEKASTATHAAPAADDKSPVPGTSEPPENPDKGTSEDDGRKKPKLTK